MSTTTTKAKEKTGRKALDGRYVRIEDHLWEGCATLARRRDIADKNAHSIGLRMCLVRVLREEGIIPKELEVQLVNKPGRKPKKK